LINNNTSNPEQLNSWCKSTPNCYDDSNDLSESAIQEIDPTRIFWNDDTSMHRTNDLSFETIISYIQKGRIVIANVNDGHHFVLITGYSFMMAGFVCCFGCFCIIYFTIKEINNTNFIEKIQNIYF
jgi:hypothetical protein